MHILAPRYHLEEKSSWLEGIDPKRYYWIAVNGDPGFKVAIPGLTVSNLTDLKTKIRRLRSLQSGEYISIVRKGGTSKIYCINEKCYAIETEVKGANVWHLFDYETLDSLLMTSHPNWQCDPKDADLISQDSSVYWQQVAVA